MQPGDITVPQEAEQDSKKRKTPGRARQSCEACRASKSKCDVLTTRPCRRCQLHNISCHFEGAVYPDTPKSVASSQATSNMDGLLSRLDRIEIALSHLTSARPSASAVGSPVVAAPSHLEAAAFQDNQPPIKVVRTLSEVYNLAGQLSSETIEELPDAVNRGILTEDHCDELFRFYHEKLAICDTLCLDQLDRDCANTRRKSPLLFNSILLASAYYLFLSSNAGRAAYAALLRLQAELLGPLLLSCRQAPSSLSIESIRALLINICRKPIQQADVVDQAIPLVQQLNDKFNAATGSILISITKEMASLLGLRSRTTSLLEAHETPDEAGLACIRTWLSLCSADAFAECQAGRSPGGCALDDEMLLERFVNISHTPNDIQTAAFVAFFMRGAEARSYHIATQGRQNGIAQHDQDIVQLRRFRAQVMGWREIWLPRVRMPSLISLTYRFFRLLLVTRYATRWIDEYKADTPNINPFIRFTAPQLEMLRYSVLDAQEALFFLSEQSIAPECLEGRSLNWIAAPGTGGVLNGPNFEPLTPDEKQVDLISGSIDAISCAIVPFFALFLCSSMYRNMTCNLKVLDVHALLPTTEPIWMNACGKLGRLLQLSAEVLERAAPTSTHPCIGHAKMLRALYTRAICAPETLAPPGTFIWDVNESPISAEESHIRVTETANMLDLYLDPLAGAPGPGVPLSTDTFDYNAVINLQDVDWLGAL